ncbi:DUF802 domain-containing protein [Ideonella alba]|uniref:DUF802 domain-containing protein n=1 Tax=Ideonella alba TaxID=2824118 RepID=A0A941BEI1_9BURK|nr:DUF802 domain-containing protein [Ideonella alba]MBQ0931156.1 DUF802 domain-containing protein [Ideonella alba]
MTRLLYPAALLAGLLAIAWIAVGYLSTSLPALLMMALIAAFYALGALELRRLRADSAALRASLTEAPPASPGDWLAVLPAAWRPALQARLDGQRLLLPGAALTPYLVGLLVLLGMLGTFLGMVATLAGTGQALERAGDLALLRDALAAPVKGLGLAFGTSVAGVAASAALGLMSALARLEQSSALALLDERLAGPWRALSAAQRADEARAEQRRQAELLPALVQGVQALLASQQAEQRAFHEATSASYRALAEQVAGSLDRTVRDSVAGSLQQAALGIQPVVEATMAGLTREAQAMHGRVADTLAQQLQALGRDLAASSDAAVQAWQAAQARQQADGQAQAARLQGLMDTLAQGFEQRSASLLAQISERHGALQTALAGAAQQVARDGAALHERSAATLAEQLGAVSAQLEAAVAGVSDRWQAALDAQTAAAAQLNEQQRAQAVLAAQQFERQADALLQALQQAQSGLQAELAARDEARLGAWTQALNAQAAALQLEWREAGAQALAQQQQICATLEGTAGRMAAQAEAHAQGTIDEIARLVQAASEAPRAAAELVAQLRDKLSDSLARDTAMLAERERLLATLQTLLGAVEHAAGGQRQALDTLLASTADWQARTEARIGQQIDAESARLQDLSARVGAGAAELGSLGEAFGAAVQGFQLSTQQLAAQLQRIEEALERSMARSDEQLGYYVAQAREVIDLSLLAHKRIVDDLQRLAAGRAEA